jgi:catechol 2,3-dioxygenase-like lactoylglutathione lyase family enzyme
MAIKLHAVTPRLPSSDVGATVRFYVDVLGFTIDVVVPEEKPTFASLDRDAVNIQFYAEDKPSFVGQFVIETTDIAAMHAAVRDRAKIAWGPEVYPYGRREFALEDPNGHNLIFSEPTDDPPTCEG